MNLMQDKCCREQAFNTFLKTEPDLTFDWFCNYFQEGSANKKKMMQDFTPRGVARLLPQLLGDFESCLDVCAGTGGLTVAAWNKNPRAFFVCEELSRRAFPLLLFNLAMRNIEGLAINKDVLTGEVFSVYRLAHGERFSTIEPAEDASFAPVDICVTNPPYSLKWGGDFKGGVAGFGCPPRDKADYAFVLYGFAQLKAGGRLCAILPTGTLFRGHEEQKIRKNLIDGGHLAGIIALPEKLFLDTSIPVALMLLRRQGAPQIPAIIIDASREYQSGRRQNALEESHIDKIVLAYERRLAIERYSQIVPIEKIQFERHNLNVPRYVDTYIPAPLPDMGKTCAELIETNREIKKANRQLYKMLMQMTGSGKDNLVALEQLRSAFAAMGGISHTCAEPAELKVQQSYLFGGNNHA